jgi:hypothetical protein
MFFLLISLIALLIILLILLKILSKPQNEHFTSPKNNTVVIDSLNWIKPQIQTCYNKPHHVALLNINLEKVSERSPIICQGLGTINLDGRFSDSKNSKTILTGKKDIVALLWSDYDGKGQLLGMLPSPTGTKYTFQGINISPKSLTVKKHTEISLDIINNLAYTLPPRRWSCSKTDNKWYPNVAKSLYGNLEEDNRSVKCTKEGKPYFTDTKAKFKLPEPKKPNLQKKAQIKKQLEKKQFKADLMLMKLNQSK